MEKEPMSGGTMQADDQAYYSNLNSSQAKEDAINLIEANRSMPESLLNNQVERTAEGRFVKGQSGNPAGKPPGCRNHATRAAEAFLDGEAEALTHKAVALALDGDPTALRLCLDRVIAPRRGRAVRLDLPPITTVADTAEVMGAVTAAVAAGNITPVEGVEIAKIVDIFVRAIEAGDFERRLTLLESGHAADS
jgi:hypothetical protein